ncbi:hypothetical protein BG58_31235 [Caballeronia jiangsuensis]|nr:hypothetical protein BG58_31235 [Caballeronia jiangsuensis]
MRFSASARIHAPYRRTSSASPFAPDQSSCSVACFSSAGIGPTGLRPAKRGGISIIALLIVTATGLRSDA